VKATKFDGEACISDHDPPPPPPLLQVSTDIGQELQMRLPLGAAPAFPAMFQELEVREGSLMLAADLAVKRSPASRISASFSYRDSADNFDALARAPSLVAGFA
jgi:hypothetical protein